MKRNRVFNAFKIAVLCVLVFVLILWEIPNIGAQESENEQEVMSKAADINTVEMVYANTAEDIPLLNLSEQTTQVDNPLPTEQVSVEEGETDGLGGSGGVLALWVNGVRVVQTPEQVAAWEKKLYSCKTVEEYEAFLKNVAYYNKGIDMAKFPWYWDELKELYTDEQIQMMKDAGNKHKRVPNIVGMSRQQAYDTVTKAGLIVRLVSVYDPNTDVPEGYCYWQEVSPGTSWNVGASFFAYIQAPNTSVPSKITVPNVVGLIEGDARQRLEYAGFTNLDFQYEVRNDDTPAEHCIGQSLKPGTQASAGDYFRIVIKLDPPPAPTQTETTPTETPQPEPPQTETPQPETAPTEGAEASPTQS